MCTSDDHQHARDAGTWSGTVGRRVVTLAVVAVLWLGDGRTSATEPLDNPFLAAGVPDSGWTFVRGPQFNAHSPEKRLADRWPAQGPPVLWTRTLGSGYSALIAWDHQVATQYQTMAGQYVICLDADTGDTVWRYRYELPYELAGVYPGPRATPTYADGCIYFASPRGLVGCLGATSGKLRWSVDLRRRFGGAGTDFGYACSPTVVDGKVIMPVGAPGASLVAFDAHDGALVWQAGTDAASYTPAYPITLNGHPLVLGYLQNVLVCHDLKTGKLLWRHVLSNGYDEHSAWPLYQEPHLWIASPFQAGSELLRLTGAAAQPIKIVRKSRLMSNDIFASLLLDGAVYGFDLREAQAKVHRPSRGQFRCVDLLSGDVCWSTGSAKLRRTTDTQHRDIGKRIGHATLLYADGKLILLNDTGELILARATREKYEELGRVSVLAGEICWTRPTLHRGRVFVRNASRAVCVYVGEPALLDQRLRAHATTAADIPQSAYVDLASIILSVEPEYAFDIPSNAWLGQWFVVSLLGILGGSALVVSGCRLLAPSRLAADRARRMFWCLAFLSAAAGTTLIGRTLDRFVFTWPVALFVSFQAVVWENELRRADRGASRTGHGRIALLLFAATCLAYFLLCRRLSLVFEWVFLCGFTAAAPPLLVGKYWPRKRGSTWPWEVATTAIAFAAFYWSSVFVLWIKSG